MQPGMNVVHEMACPALGQLGELESPTESPTARRYAGLPSLVNGLGG